MSVNECAVTSQELKKDYTEQIQGESRCKASPLILTILEKFLRVNFRLRLNPTCFKILTLIYSALDYFLTSGLSHAGLSSFLTPHYDFLE